MVSLDLMQSISCLCVFSPCESILLSPTILPLIGVKLALGRADLPSKRRTRRRSVSLMVSSTHLSSPCNACSMAWGRLDLRRLCVMVGEPLHRVERREMVVDTDGDDLAADSGVAPGPPGVPDTLVLWFLDAAAWLRRLNNSVVSPFSAKGAGSMPFLMNLSAREAKHLRAPSATCWSSYLSREDRLSTQEGRQVSWGSILLQRRDTTDMAE